MAVPYRLPEPQKLLTSLYSRPNKTGPQQQAVDTGMSEMANALLRAVQPITDYGVIKQNEEKDLIAREESIKIENMAIEEQREYLAKIAREAEESGALATGTNFFRHKFVQEQLAEKLMRNRYSDSLTNQFHRYTDPTENLSGADAQQFALDAYKTIENESITGFYARSRAQQIYSELSTNWLANVRDTARTRMVAKNKSDVAEFTVAELGRVIDGETDIEEARAAINKVADSLKMVGGGSGREEVAKGMKTLLANAISQAVDARDLVELDALETLYNSLRQDEDGNAYTTGVLAFGDEQASIMESIDTLFAKGHARLKRTDREDKTEENQKVEDAVALLLFDYSAADLQDVPTVNHAIRTALESQGFSKEAIASTMNNFGILIERAQSSWQSDEAAENLAAEILLQVDSGDIDPTAAKAVIRNIDGLDPKSKVMASRDVDALIAAKRRTEANILSGAKAASVESVETIGAMAEAAAASLQTEDVYYSSGVATALVQWANKKATEAYEDKTGTDEEKTQAAKDSYAATTQFMKDITLNTSRGIDFNLEKAYDGTLPTGIADELAKVSYAMAERQLNEDRMIPIVASQEAKIDPLTGLWGGWGWFSPSYDHPPELGSLYGGDKGFGEGVVADINLMVSEIRPDAQKHIKDIMDKYLYRKQYNFLEKLPFTATRWGGTKILTSKGFLLTSAVDAAKPWQDDLVPDIEGTDYHTLREHTGDYLQVVRIVGLTPEHMADGMAYGLDISHFADLRDPHRTLMVNADTFIKDIEALAAVNKPEMSQEDLLDKLQGNGIAEGYRAYRKMVGKDDAVGFDYFIKATLNGIGRYSVPYVNEDIRKKLGVPLVAGDDDD